jgi:saccharopine dehydrogenase-like NADP-dependent oxidoreductase
VYGIPECGTVIRGTLRNQGWCEKIKKLVDLGYVEETPLEAGLSYAALTAKLIGKAPSKDLPTQVAGEAQE